jgi:hypothetical protein
MLTFADIIVCKQFTVAGTVKVSRLVPRMFFIYKGTVYEVLDYLQYKRVLSTTLVVSIIFTLISSH